MQTIIDVLKLVEGEKGRERERERERVTRGSRDT